MANTLTLCPRPTQAGGSRRQSVLWQPWMCGRWKEGAPLRTFHSQSLDITGDCAKRRRLYLPKISLISTTTTVTLLTPKVLEPNLLRWNASLSRDGNLFTEEEKKSRPEIAALTT